MSIKSPSPERRPAITAPVSRHLVVADVARSLTFYRDVLGFEVRPLQGEYEFPAVAEVVYGPARIQLGTTGRAADDTEPQHAILFFQTEDVTAMHDVMSIRGAKPSALEKVNWIKMRLFEIRDPDGHALWFGQSLQQPEAPVPEPMLRTIIPDLPLNDVATGIAYYRDMLGFRVNYAQHDLAIMDRDRARVALIARTERHTGIGSCYVYVRDADALHAELLANGANVQGEPISMPWGLRQFHVLDLEGNRIAFGQTFE